LFLSRSRRVNLCFNSNGENGKNVSDKAANSVENFGDEDAVLMVTFNGKNHVLKKTDAIAVSTSGESFVKPLTRILIVPSNSRPAFVRNRRAQTRRWRLSRRGYGFDLQPVYVNDQPTQPGQSSQHGIVISYDIDQTLTRFA